ncbi:hypothetical protein TSUD_375500 [Trifolium subterraneum]|uniref:Protein kinase domain-containing protein n=1 Tax=Trifolium subterraneum TaxID=3900 RepID=A0A2Z6NYU2_TRISU|nr:hypothetical protein TSUD_375500 [Trifolium subterraneum]
MELNPTLLQFLLLLFAVPCFTSTSTLNETCGHFDASFNRDTKAPCPNGWVMDPNKTKCFLHVGRPQSWNDSETCCNKYGGHLASLSSLQELHFAQSLCGESINSCWIGGRRLNNTISGFQWTWSDNSQWNKSMFPLANVPLNCTGTGQSCLRNITENVCSVMTNNSKSLISERCDNPHASLCILDIDAKCNRHRDYLIILAVVSGLILSTTLAVIVWLLVYKRGKKRRRSRKLTDPAASLPSWKVFTKEELRSITKNFSEGNRLVGDAKAGGTYSGVQPDGSKVAVKRLKRSSFKRKKEFYSEIGRVARLRHPNLVVVMGCCYDHGDRYIVYEFVANGPLDKWLHHIPRGGRSLDWAMRMKIATTLAQGIAFLHDKVKPQVVHRDIRASNVLLDEEFGAHLMAHRYPELLDPYISSSSTSIIPETSSIQKVVDLVYSCTQHVPSMRPRMSHVVHQLQQFAQPPKNLADTTAIVVVEIPKILTLQPLTVSLNLV